MLRKRTRLSAVGFVILGTVVVGNPQTSAQLTSEPLPTRTLPNSPASSVGPTRISGKSAPYVPAKLNIGEDVGGSQTEPEAIDPDWMPAPRLADFRSGPIDGPISGPIDIEEVFESQDRESQDREIETEDQAFLHPSAYNSKKESVNDVFVGSGESETDLLDVDPGLPEVDPNLIEDVRIAEDEQVDEPENADGIAVAGELKNAGLSENSDRKGRPIRTPLTVRELGGEPSSHEPAPEDDAPSETSRSHVELQMELHQEAPIIDVRGSQSRRNEQGVDALLATKPVSIKREAANGEVYEPSTALPPIVSGNKLPALNRREADRLDRTNACLSHYLTHAESTSVRSPWAVMHALLAFGPDYELQHGDSRVNAIGWMCHNGTCRTQRMFTPKGNGFVPNVGAGVQGHEGQFLAILAQSNVPLDYPIQIGTNKYRVEDLVRYEMATCKENTELTFKLIGLSYYLDSNKQWKANDGRVWSIQKLIQQELAQPVIGAACGGTHRLMGFSFAVRQRAMQGEAITGQYARANQFVKSYIDYTWKLQNPDGSFSTSWYEGRGNEPNDERKVQTTGHMLEWLMYTLPDSEINQPRVQKSVDFLLSMIYDKKEHNWPIGPRGHALRAVGLYQARYQEVFNSAPELLESASQHLVQTNNSNLIPKVPEGAGARPMGASSASSNAAQNGNRGSSASGGAHRSATRLNLLQPNRGRSAPRHR